MVAFNRTEGFCPDSISIDDGKVFHIHGFVDVGKSDSECYCVDCTSRYTLPGYLSEALQDLLRVIVTRQGTHGWQWWYIRSCFSATSRKDEENKQARQENILPHYHGKTTLGSCSKNHGAVD